MNLPDFNTHLKIVFIYFYIKIKYVPLRKILRH